jgi:hypothetical protein
MDDGGARGGGRNCRGRVQRVRCRRNYGVRQAKSRARRLTFSRAPATNPPMSALPPCPHLPAPRAGLDWRALHVYRGADRGAEFYLACLEYGHALWQRRLAARAILCLDRALGADLRGDEPVLRTWPLPYGAMTWFVAHTPPEIFVGNPRVHFQHYADRMNEPRRAQRVARAWACWALVRAVRPDLPGDPRHRVIEPSPDEIAAQLCAHGHAGEVELWRAAVKNAGR